MGACIVEVCGAVPRLPELQFRSPIDWQIREGEHWAILGPNGAGKTVLVNILQRKYALKAGHVVYHLPGGLHELVKCIEFRDIYSLADLRNGYYQQRWHATEAEDVPTVAETLRAFPNAAELFTKFHLDELLPKKIIYLSSGELRKFLIARALLSIPKILILDNPFIGLDAASRDLLTDLLRQIKESGVAQVVLLLSNPADIPAFITHVLPVSSMLVGDPVAYTPASNLAWEGLFPVDTRGEIELPSNPDRVSSAHRVTCRLENITIRYGSRTILKDLNWVVRNGEKWALVGPNGSGKSTLLSLICADNPQAYANTIYLFDKKRGSGESIWEIKKRIGYVSPEMHLYYQENVSALSVVASGFFDTVGLYRKCTPEQLETARAWMRLFHLEPLQDRPFLQLSSGFQRLVLLVRAFVKDPDLLILDEPLHGLDVTQKAYASKVIDKFCNRLGKSLIYVTHYPQELPPCIKKTFSLAR